MALTAPNLNKITLWQGFSTFGEDIDTIVIYEPTHLKVVMKLSSSSKDHISLEFNDQKITMVIRETGHSQTLSGDRTACWSEQSKRVLWIPFPADPNKTQWEESNDILSVTIPWLTNP